MKFLIAIAILGLADGAAYAQTDLKTYTDAKGYLNVQTLTCGQLASTFQEDADMLAAWYSGWYNGLAKGNRANIAAIKEAEHRVIVYCKANPGAKVITAIDTIFTRMRAERGIVLK